MWEVLAMTTLAVAFPVLPGKAEAGRQFAKDVMGARCADQQASFRRMGVTREAWFLQSTPMGDMILVWIEGEDPAEGLRTWAASTDPHDVWFKQQAGAICGLDFSQPIPSAPEQILELEA
jgi:hypothetical protein